MISMGGRIGPGKRIIGSVVPAETRDFLEKQVEAGNFKTLSKAINHYLKLGIRTSHSEFSNKIEPEDDAPKRSRLRFLRRRE